jgi:hypothetical protein
VSGRGCQSIQGRWRLVTCLLRCFQVLCLGTHIGQFHGRRQFSIVGMCKGLFEIPGVHCCCLSIRSCCVKVGVGPEVPRISTT